MDSASFPFEKLAPIALAQISALNVPAAEPALPELIPATLAILGSTEAGERMTRRVETLTVTDAMPQNALEIPAVAAEDWSKYQPASNDVLSHFGMPQQPFDVTPDPTFLYSSPSHREALASLKEGIEHFRGFMVMIAEPGMGKTTLLHKLMEELSETARVVFLFQTQCSSRDLLCYILNELEVDHTGMDVVAMHRALNQALLEEMLRGRRFVLVVDEAQNLQEPVLETIRLLSDFETTNSKLIQIVLAGQPQLCGYFDEAEPGATAPAHRRSGQLEISHAHRDRRVHRISPARRRLERQTGFLQRGAGSDCRIQPGSAAQHQQPVLQFAAAGIQPAARNTWTRKR